MLKANGSDPKSRLQLTTTKKGVLWIDQVSAMPTDTYKGHGFRKDLFEKLLALEPRFVRFPDEWIQNAFRWKATIGPWEDRPGHFGDAWKYWSDDGLGYFEYLQLTEDLGATPVWVINDGIDIQDGVETSSVSSLMQEMLNGIEFARGDNSSKWGFLRATMGHPEPFELKHVAIGYEDCGKTYKGNYLKFYAALRRSYPDIQVISNCNALSHPLNHPADMFDYHVYGSANEMFARYSLFDKARRDGPKAVVSEYAVVRKDAGLGNLLAALGEAGFLIGLERNSDVVEMASYAPLFTNANDRRWNPNVIVFDSAVSYGTPSYWMQQFFAKSSGGFLLKSTLKTSFPLVASAVSWKSTNTTNCVTIKVVNFGKDSVKLKLSISSEKNATQFGGSKKTTLTSDNPKEENSFSNPRKVSLSSTNFRLSGIDTNVLLQPYSLTSFELIQH